MIIECFSISAIIFAISVIFLRARKKDYALATIPLIILPLANVVAAFFAKAIAEITPSDLMSTYMFINIAAAAVSCAFVGIMTMKFKKKSTRVAYMGLTTIFNVVLVVILIQNMSTILPLK